MLKTLWRRLFGPKTVSITYTCACAVDSDKLAEAVLARLERDAKNFGC